MDEGAFVKKGQVIARIDRQQVEQQRSKDEAGLAASQAQYDQIEPRSAGSRRRWRARLRCAEPRSGQRKRTWISCWPDRVRRRSSRRSRGGRHHRTARTGQSRLGSPQDLLKNDDISRAQHDRYRMRLDTRTAVWRQAQSRAGAGRGRPAQGGHRSRRARNCSGRKRLSQASQANRLELKRREQELNTRRAEVWRARRPISP